MYSAHEVARAVLTHVTDRGVRVDGPFLHRAVYLVWIDCLKYTGRRLFDEPFTMSDLCPVVEGLVESYGTAQGKVLRRFVPFRIPGRAGHLFCGTVDRCLAMDGRALGRVSTMVEGSVHADPGTEIGFWNLKDYVEKDYPPLLQRPLFF